MPRGFILAGLRFFGTAAALGLALVALAPIGGVRLLGLVGLACAVTGLVLHIFALHRVDPEALPALRSRFEASVNRTLARGLHVASIVGGGAYSALVRAMRWNT